LKGHNELRPIKKEKIIMFLQSLESLDVFQQDIPKFPMGKYAHIVVLRATNSFALFQTDGELNISRVSLGRREGNQGAGTRIVLFKRKQSTPERLTGRELLRRYELVSHCQYNSKDFCKRCPDCTITASLLVTRVLNVQRYWWIRHFPLLATICRISNLPLMRPLRTAR
jgi:hypothetical protein